jgi:hypothetical protein
VAGTVAGVTGKIATVECVAIDDMSGVAPGAWLGDYNVFPGNVLNARSEYILDAVDAAVVDGMDVLNLSLGGSYHGNPDLLAMGLDNAGNATAGRVAPTTSPTTPWSARKRSFGGPRPPRSISGTPPVRPGGVPLFAADGSVGWPIGRTGPTRRHVASPEDPAGSRPVVVALVVHDENHAESANERLRVEHAGLRAAERPIAPGDRFDAFDVDVGRRPIELVGEVGDDLRQQILRRT